MRLSPLDLINTILSQVHSSEGQYLGLALEMGFKQEGCPFEFGSVNWLSGTQEEVEDKMTLLASPDGEVSAGKPIHSRTGVIEADTGPAAAPRGRESSVLRCAVAHGSICLRSRAQGGSLRGAGPQIHAQDAGSS